MTLQTLYDQLLELRIPAFRQALQEQQANPQFTELTFEERLALLVDHECTQRRDIVPMPFGRTAFDVTCRQLPSRSLPAWKSSTFPQPAVWSDARSSSWDSAIGSPPDRTSLSSVPPGRGKVF